MTEQELFDILLRNRNILDVERQDFLHPKYQALLAHNPFLLPDMDKAVQRLKLAHDNNESVLIYGDYDADGVTSTSLLLDAFDKFGFKNIYHQIPNRFKHGYGLNEDLITSYKDKVSLIVTVDCGSANHQAINFANQLKIDVIVTDHHSVSDVLPEAVAVVNPRRLDNHYPDPTLAGVGVAFNLVRAMQTTLPGLEYGQEKWLLDLVAIGTITDLMDLRGDNRILVRFGLEVLKKTRRHGIRLLFNESGLELNEVNSSSVGFGIGPRLNAAGRLESAELALDVLTANTELAANQVVQKLIFLNQKRRALQDQIFNQACLQAEADTNSVLVLKGTSWHEGVVGIVASKIMEQFKKPTFVLQEKDGILKGSARSFGDFSIYESLKESTSEIISGGGHNVAGGLKLKASQFNAFRSKVNQFYDSLKLVDQTRYLELNPEVWLKDFSSLTLNFFKLYLLLEPFGKSNPEPIFGIRNVKVKQIRRMGKENQHLKLTLLDRLNHSMEFILFGDGQKHQLAIGDRIDLSFILTLNSWQGKNVIEGRVRNIMV